MSSSGNDFPHFKICKCSTEFFNRIGGERSYAASASLDCLSGECRHSDKYINGASFCGVEGGSEPTVDVMKSCCTRSPREEFLRRRKVHCRRAAGELVIHAGRSENRRCKLFNAYSIASVNNATVEGSEKWKTAFTRDGAPSE